MESTVEVLSDFKRNNRWIIENYDKLKNEYGNQWVAVLNNAVIDQDPELKKLVRRLKTQHSSVYGQIAVEYVSSDELEFAADGFTARDQELL